jgi:hypothetical protein
MTGNRFGGQTECYSSDPVEGHGVYRAPYEGKLVLTVHSTVEQEDPDQLARELEQWMRDNHLSRVNAFWNAVPPEGDDEQRDGD